MKALRREGGHSAAASLAALAPPPLAQVAVFCITLPLYAALPGLPYAYEAYRSEEQIFTYSQAIHLIESGRFRWAGGRTVNRMHALTLDCVESAALPPIGL